MERLSTVKYGHWTIFSGESAQKKEQALIVDVKWCIDKTYVMEGFSLGRC
jgi:hypothetical protein